MSIIERTTFRLCLWRHEAAEVYLTEELKHAETNPTCEIHESYCTSQWNSRQKSFARTNLPRWTSSAQPQRSKIWGSVSGGDRVTSAKCPRSSVEAGQKCIQIKGARKSNILLTCPASNLKLEEREFVVDSGASMHMISKKGLEFCWNGYLDEIVQSYDSHNRQWRSADAWGGNGVCQRIGYISLTMKVLENTPAVLSLGKLCDENGYSCDWINGQIPHLIWNGIRIQCNTENFVPIVVFGLSSSSSSNFPSSTSMTPSRQETDHPTSSSSSSTSPTTTVRGKFVEFLCLSGGFLNSLAL